LSTSKSKLTDFRDLEIAKNVAGVNAKELVQLLPVLEKQYALVTGEAFLIPEIVRINDANPLPLSNGFASLILTISGIRNASPVTRA